MLIKQENLLQASSC